MSTKNEVTVHEKQFKKIKGKPVSFFATIKTSGSETDAKKAVDQLKKQQSKEFEVRNLTDGTKTVYKKLLTSFNYEVKVCKIE